MLVVDASVWIGFFNGAGQAAQAVLRRVLDGGDVRIVVPDLVLYEVLRGFRDERDHRRARLLMEALDIEPCGGESLAVRAAEQYRALRATGITVRSSIDVLVATFCIERDYVLLHDDRDFDAFERHRGLKAWRH